jgi:capsule polysaccharide export protein KpsE/RkpR
MNQPITFTPQQVFEMILWVCGAIVSVSAAIAVIAKVIQKAKAPEKTQNERIEKLESDVKSLKQYLDNDNKRLKALEEGNIVTQQALLALLSHALNGNDIDSLKEAKTKLEKYLIGKGNTYET